ncbi:MAG: DUF2147 domain-containing protein [bacterium]|nr:DUF2147 domain-containing protein [bacterium]
MRHFATIVALLVLIVPSGAFASEEGELILGVWASEPNSETGNAHIEVYKEGELFSGKVVWLEKPQYNPDDERGMAGQDKIDRENPDAELQSRPIMGLNLLEGFEYVGKKQWKKGTIYDPDNGKTYKCKIKLNTDGTLKIRGFIGISLLGRNTMWTKVEMSEARK